MGEHGVSYKYHSTSFACKSYCFTHEPFGQSRGRLVHGALAVLVLDGDESAALEQILGAILKLPEARVVQRGVAMLVDKVDVGFVLKQLKSKENSAKAIERTAILPCSSFGN